MALQASGLRYAVRPNVLLKYFGQLNLILAILTIAPLGVSLLFGEFLASLRYCIVLCALLIFWFSTIRVRAPADMQNNEGLVLAALIFLFTPLVMAYPMMYPGSGFLDAFFEAVSGITTTGLSTRETLNNASVNFLFARAWMQWYGGLGIVVLSLAFVLRPGLAAKSLAGSGVETDDLVGGTRARARKVFRIYCILTFLGIIGSLLAGVSFFESLLFSLSAVSTGGFAPYDSSIANLGVPAQGWITLASLTAAVPLTFYSRIFSKRNKAGLGIFQLKAIIIACVVVSLAVATSMRICGGMAWSQILHHAPLLAFSAQTTAGFSSLSPAELDSTSKLLLTFSMLIGGDMESTAGGFKLLRLLIAAHVFQLLLLRSSLPKHAVIDHRLADHPLHEEEIRNAFLLIVLFIGIVAVSWIPFVAMGFDPIDSLFEVASATGTVGLSTGITSSTLPSLLKGVLCIDMLMGRLEIIAWLVLLYPKTWIGRRMEGT
ncbi:TrkH family potassium uptake protein [Desulfogranum japonicum]|uniref:TrkH family potassium uptake protein n=1 Tax=Desulfogranum japonicum TaxID=231447 RepID=UPI00041F0E4D|nr:potassium transporter TrkG [Desulfogranum japonicum]